MKKIIYLSLALVMVGSGGLLTAHYWRQASVSRQSRAVLGQVESAIADGRYQDALAVINIRPAVGKDPDVAARWVELEVECCAQLGLLSRLETLSAFHSEITIANEAACILLARLAMHVENDQKVKHYSEPWRRKSSRPHYWTAFEADRLALKGEKQEAIELLNSVAYQGTNDCGRLLRLAKLSYDSNPELAWSFLDQAYRLDVHNPEVRLYRAQFYEAVGRPREARIEYLAAHYCDTNNPVHQDALGSFFIRQRVFAEACDVYRTGLDSLRPDFVWTKAFFWNRVVKSDELPAYPELVSRTTSREYNHYLYGLPENSFWSEAQMDLLGSRAQIKRVEQSAFWLQVLEHLRTASLAPEAALSESHERKALDLLMTRRNMQDLWSREIYSALYRVLYWRKRGYLDPAQKKLPTLSGANSHSLFRQLESAAMAERKAKAKPPADLQIFLESPNAPALVFLAGGWFQAGLDLLNPELCRSDEPTWIPYAIVQATRLVQGTEKALDLAQKMPKQPAISMLIAELKLATGGTTEAVAILDDLAGAATPVGYRAAWLLSKYWLEQDQPAKGMATVEKNSLLREALLGRETQTLGALQAGRREATAQLQSLGDDSLVANALRARELRRQGQGKSANALLQRLEELVPGAIGIRRAQLNLNSDSRNRPQVDSSVGGT